jgi:hypothetical protein
MARTGTQTTLTRVTKLLASLNGELAFVKGLVARMPELTEGFAPEWAQGF